MAQLPWRRLIPTVLLLTLFALILKPIIEQQLWQARMAAARRPVKVESADDLARRSVPGWTRAEALGLVVPVNQTIQLPLRNGTFTIEKAWVTGRTGYLLVTNQMDGDEYLVINHAWIEAGLRPTTSHQVDLYPANYVNKALGISSAGLHAIIAISNPEEIEEKASLVVGWWAYINPAEGMTYQGWGTEDITIDLPWAALQRTEPQPERIALNQQGEWLGRTLTLHDLAVEVGRISLTGEVSVLEGESYPRFSSTLHVGDAERPQRAYQAEPTDRAGVYRFTAQYDGPDKWPQPVRLQVHAINFQTEQVLEWQIPYQYGVQPDKLIPAAKQPVVRFYDQDLPVIYSWTEGASVQEVEVKSKPPYVKSRLSGAGRTVSLRQGFEVFSPTGEAISDMGGGGGTIWSRHAIRFGPIRLFDDHRSGVSPRWGANLPESFRQADTLSLRYYYPGASLVIDETWNLK